MKSKKTSVRFKIKEIRDKNKKERENRNKEIIKKYLYKRKKLKANESKMKIINDLQKEYNMSYNMIYKIVVNY